MRALARAIDHLELPAVEKIAEASEENPFEVLIATMLSAQTRDAVTAAASARLFKVARTPRAIARLTERRIEKLIYPVSFYRNKATHVRETSRILAEQFDSRVPVDDGGAADAAGSGPEDCQPRPDSVVQEPTQHLRRHPRASNLESSWLGPDANAGGDRAGALRKHRGAVVAVHQPVSGDVGTERMPSGLPTLRRVRHSSVLPSDRRHRDREGMKRRYSVFAALLLTLASASALLGQTSGPGDRCRDDEGDVRVRNLPERGTVDCRSRRRPGEGGILRRPAGPSCCSRIRRAVGRPKVARSGAGCQLGRGRRSVERQFDRRRRDEQTADAYEGRSGGSPTRETRRRPTVRSTSLWRIAPI